MAIPKTIDACREHLFTDKAEMIRCGVPDILQDRILRIRNVYTQWVSDCYLQDKDVVSHLMHEYNVSQSTAYEDIRLVKQLLGDVNEAKKSFHRWKFNAAIGELISNCRKEGDYKNLNKALATYAKYNQLEQPDEKEIPYEDIVVQPFDVVDDPTILGVDRVPNLDAKIKALNERYAGDIEDVDFEDVDYNFNLNGNGKTDETTLL